MVEKPNPDTDTDRPPLIHRELGDGRLRFGPPDGTEDEWIDAEATVPIEHAR